MTRPPILNGTDLAEPGKISGCFGVFEPSASAAGILQSSHQGEIHGVSWTRLRRSLTAIVSANTANLRCDLISSHA